MSSQAISSVENNFTKGLITEFTGMNFPENAATDTDNCVYTVVGDTVRRLGINTELHGTTLTIDRTNKAMSSCIWSIPGGDGDSRLEVRQVGGTLYFYNIATATTASPVSTKLLSTNVNLVAINPSLDITEECTYAQGNGYLFVFHSDIDPVYVTYDPVALTVSSNTINIQVRDFLGVLDTLQTNTRPSTLSNEHLYNLENQGWTSGNPWGAVSFTFCTPGVGQRVFTIGTVTGIVNGSTVTVKYNSLSPFGDPWYCNMAGSVVSYTGGVLTVNIFSVDTNLPANTSLGHWIIAPISNGYIGTWQSAEGSYPSNADVWWYFKDSTGVFNPATVQPNVTLSFGSAPRGHFVLSAFNQDRTSITGVTGIPPVTTTKRPTNGTWFQGRIWYTGISASDGATVNTSYYNWTENIYFSQVVQQVNDFGSCFQVNDPTSENLFDLLPTDGGVISIHGTGVILKLFPIQNGLLVFADNGIWFITGSQGIGFSANDYTVTKISNVKCVSNTSFVDVLGLPYFWNEEGIYRVEPSQGGQLTVEPITVGTILSFYNSIPFQSRRFARGYYNPVDYAIQWVFKSISETTVTSRYEFDRILNYNVYNKAFFPYTVSVGPNSNFIHDVLYITYPFVGNTTPDPGFKYPSSSKSGSSYLLSIAEEYDTNNVDWGNVTYESFFITGYKLHGKAQQRFQIPYIYLYFRQNGEQNAARVQGIWDYALTPDTGRWSTAQMLDMYKPDYGVLAKRVKIRGRGLVLQLKLSSVGNLPFDVIGWSIYETLNTGV